MDMNKLCPGCMQEVENRGSVATCPHCGYDLTHMKADPHQMQPFTILAGKYLVGKVIGEGGFGISYLGFDLNLELTVAIKEFYPNGFVTRESNVTTMVSMYAGKNEADVSKWREGFIDEARNLAKFSNLNGIVEVRDFFNENGTAYIVMEYIDGVTLKQYLKQNGGKLPVDKTFEMMEPVIRSLSKVHDAGMIHRDISPDNIMITKYGGMKLLDFGAAREFAGNAEKSLSIMLKPGYAPEEQYRSRGKQGPWSDVYALTATIYKCITGITPVESMERMREDTLKMPKELGIAVSEQQNAAIKQGMEVYAEKRFQNMDELHAALYSRESQNKAAPLPKPVKDVEKVLTKQGEKRSDVNINIDNEQKKNIIIGGAAVCCILLVFLCIVLIFGKKTKDNIDQKAMTVNVESTEEILESEQDDTKDDADSVDRTASVRRLMNEENYEEAIDEIVELNLSEEEGAEILQQAINALYLQCVDETTSLANNGDFDTAFSMVDERKQYFLDVADKMGYVKDAHEYDLTQQRYEIGIRYRDYMYEFAEECASNEDETGFLDALRNVRDSEYDSDANIDRKTEKCYTDMVLVHLDRMTTLGSSYEDRMNYIHDNLSKAGNNCLLIEMWYFYNNAYYAQFGMPSMYPTSIRNRGMGYIFPESDTRELMYYEIAELSEYELYFALFEIYARHGRTFSDPTVNNYFAQFSWYEGNIKKEDFDESVLSDVERKNISTIVDCLQL